MAPIKAFPLKMAFLLFLTCMFSNLNYYALGQLVVNNHLTTTTTTTTTTYHIHSTTTHVSYAGVSTISCSCSRKVVQRIDSSHSTTRLMIQGLTTSPHVDMVEIEFGRPNHHQYHYMTNNNGENFQSFVPRSTFDGRVGSNFDSSNGPWRTSSIAN
ncbi:hypothetical protein Scep_010630 [Stephania cephalantha]|uniref:Uncharacterized protein n=1 Tax=Stephania cephalantha TaxID=152367 RepID=A0AAP0PFF2_9MAGN